MQTNLSTQYKNTQQGQTAEAILRSCVHCGFCTATCPTYQLLGDELDGPRGRIYLIKQMLEGDVVTQKTQRHLDRCLTCRSCETTCPSGVEYGRLVDIGRQLVDEKVSRPRWELLQHKLLRLIIPYPQRFQMLLRLGLVFKPLLPSFLKQKIPHISTKPTWPTKTHTRKMLIHQGCVQSVVSANTNAATARVLTKLGIESMIAKQAGCCGALSHHLAAENESHDFIRQNIDAWWPYIEQHSIEAIISTASGCGVMLKDYAELLAQDADYAEKAIRISQLSKDISEIISQEDLTQYSVKAPAKKIAFHSACTLQHGQKINGVVETILQNVGFELTPIADSHLCCGSAGTYSILQPKLSQQLLSNKLNALEKPQPDMIATANIGCEMHLATKANVPVKHWIELLDDVYVDKETS